MIIDFHTHSFPDSLAERAVGKLAQSARAKNYLNGTMKLLRSSMKEAGIDYSVVLPVVTRPQQENTVNRLAIETNEHYRESGVLSFGGIHPYNEDYRRILRELAESGVKGVKLHPVFQQTPLDDIRYLRIIECACENNLIVLIHAGYDISFPGCEYASVSRIDALLDTLNPPKFVLAHMGGWNCWEEVENCLIGRDVWLDTSFSLLTLFPAPGTIRKPEENPPLSKERFLRMIHGHGVNRILFGTDSPWGGQRETLTALTALLKEGSLTPAESSAILGDNAAKLLGISSHIESSPV